MFASKQKDLNKYPAHQDYPHLLLHRFKADEKVTLGSLFYKKEFLCFTLELPWVDNKRGISCIPAGDYKCKYVNSPKFGFNTLKVLDVPDRSSILFHAGNSVLDSHGCILPGMEIDLERNFISKSRVAVNHLFNKTKNNFNLLLRVTGENVADFEL